RPHRPRNTERECRPRYPFSCRASFDERRLEQALAALELTLHRVDGNAPDARELPVREPIDIPQGEEHARLGRYPAQRAAEIEMGVWRIGPGGRLELAGAALAPPELVHADIGEDAVEPGRPR